MEDDNFNNIYCSRKCQDFYLLYDGIGNYYCFYNENLILESIEELTPTQFHRKYNTKMIGSTVDQMKELHSLLGKIIEVITVYIENTPKNHNKLKTVITDLIRTIKDAEIDKLVNMEHFNNAPQCIRDKAIEISIDKGFDGKLFKKEVVSDGKEKFDAIMESYDNVLEMLNSELYDYVDNTENIFKGVINCLCALLGYGSRFIVVNGGSEVGKSEFINTIKKLMPNFKNLGSSTPASVRRQDTYAFDRTIVYLGDMGLKGKSQASKDEFEGLYEVFGGLITDKEFIRDIVVGNDVYEFNLTSDGVCVLYSEPYTNLRVYGAGDQYTTRSTFITINPVQDGLSVFLQDEDQINKFYPIHNSYIKHIVENPIDLKISKEVKTKLWQSSKDSLRTAKYLLGIFKAYCQYMQIGSPIELDVDKFLDVFQPKNEVTDIEFLVYRKLYSNLKPLIKDDVEYLISDDGEIELDNMLLQIKDRKNKSFFTIKQIKTYFKSDFQRNKNLKDTLDQMGDILNNLFNAGLINKIEWQYNNQNVFYIPFNADMEK